MQIFADQGLLQELPIDPLALKRYLRTVEINYKPNPFHHRLHALDVMQSCHTVLMQSPAFQLKLTAIEKLALLLGAFVHDVGHPGVNNKLLVKLADCPEQKQRPDLAQYAMLYNNHSVLESTHISLAFRIAFSPTHKGSNPFAQLDKEEYCKLRKLMIELVMITDMEHHFKFLAQFKAATNFSEAQPTRLDLKDDAKRLMLLKAVLHSCDISNPAKSTDMAARWAHVICDEFWDQGDLEKSMDMDPEQLLR